MKLRTFYGLCLGCLGFWSRASNATNTQPSPHASVTLADLAAQRTERPEEQAWQAAPSLQLTRSVGPQASACHVQRVREWARVDCPDLRVSAITQLFGAVEGVNYRLAPKAPDGLPTSGAVVFPLRREQVRGFLIWTLGPGYDGPLTVVPAVVIQTDFRGEAPRVLLHDAVNQPVPTQQEERRRRMK